jgi:hypothetical protein
MTNAEIIAHQRRLRDHRAKLPMALDTARAACDGAPGHALVEIPAGNLCALVFEIERLSEQVRQHNEDMRDEQRAARDGQAEAYSQGFAEGRGDHF